MAQSIIARVYLGTDEKGFDISHMISGIKFKESVKKDDTLDIQIDGEYAEELLERAECYAGKPIFFSLGYITGEILLARIAILGDIEPTYSDRGTQLKLCSMDKGGKMRKVTSQKIWNKKRTDEIVKEIAQMHGLNVEFSEDVTKYREWECLPQGNMSNMNLIQFLADREYSGNFIAYVNADTLYFKPIGTGTASRETIDIKNSNSVEQFSIKYRELSADKNAGEIGASLHDKDPKKGGPMKVSPAVQINNAAASVGVPIPYGPEGSITDIQFFKTGQNFTDAYGKPIDVKVEGKKVTMTQTNQVYILDENGGLAPVRGIDNQTSVTMQMARLAGLPIISKATEDNYTQGGNIHVPGSYDYNELGTMLTAMNSKAKRKVLTASLREYGNPSRTLNTMLTITGVASRYRGNWYVEEITHDMDAGGKYMTTCELSRNATNTGNGVVVPKAMANTTQGEPEGVVIENPTKKVVGIREGGLTKKYKEPSNVPPPATIKKR
jgi:phage protein D